MKHIVVLLIAAAVSTGLLTGCLEDGTTDETPHTPDRPQNDATQYPAINLPFSQFSSKIINDDSGLGNNTVWYCYEPETGDIIDPVAVTFNADGTGTFQEWRPIEPTTWEFVGNDLVIDMASGKRTYHDVSMPISSVINATILGPDETEDVVTRAQAISDGTGPFSCQGAINTGLYADLVPLHRDQLINGPSADDANNVWQCKAAFVARPNQAYKFLLGADGTGALEWQVKTIPSELDEPMPISLWQLDNRELSITASDGSVLEVSIESHAGDSLNISTTVDGEWFGRSVCELMANDE